ncbi:MAG: hypothetical protein L0H84_16520 [Pseudonocardia sp.]|nr:hypothetical protein [Pseudonocardia sp.]
MKLSDIPSATEPTADARPSEIVARIRDLRPSRRTVLKGLFVAAAAAALVPLDWYLARRQAHADDGPRSEFMECEDGGYDEERNNWPEGGQAMCVGGFRRGSFPCSDGWHREGEYTVDGDDSGDDSGDEQIVSTRHATNCNGRNAWRWKSVRCSDALTTVYWDDGDEYTGVTIAVCSVES